MKTPLSFIKHPIKAGTSDVVFSVVYLRLIILVMTLGIFAFWQVVNDEAQLNWPFTLGVSVVIGLWSLSVLLSKTLPLAQWAVLREVCIDYLWVLIFVYLTGGTANPFIYYYLVLTALGATLLSRNQAWSLCLVGIVIYSLLLFVDLRDHMEHISEGYKYHLVGMWINFVASTVVTCAFVTKLISLLRKQHEQMTVIREETLKNEQLVGLATVSVSTIHNLSTPLSTLTVLIDDMFQRSESDPVFNDDLNLMRKQILRCKNTMGELSYLAVNSDAQSVLAVDKLMDNLKDHYALHHPRNLPQITCATESNTYIKCSPLVHYAIINLVNNALESSSRKTDVLCSSRAGNVIISIRNDSDLAARELAQRWGKPSISDKKTGLGIGSLLANSTIERQGGSVSLDISDPDNSTGRSLVTITVSLPEAAQSL